MSDIEDYPELITAPPYPDLLPPNKTKLERALAEQSGRLDSAIPVPLDRLLQADICPAAYLPWLAWHMSLDLWDWEWSETKRREVIARAVELNRMKGTAKAIREYCEVMDSEVLQIVVPPQGFYASPEMTKAEWDGWIRQMPQIRIKFATYTGYGDDEFFAAPMEQVTLPPGPPPPPEGWNPGIPLGWDGICNLCFSGRDDGWELYGRKAVIRYADGSEQPMKLTEWVEDTTVKPAVMIGRASTYGVADAGSGFWAEPEETGLTTGMPGTGGVGFCGDNAFVGFDPNAPKLITYRIDTTYDHVSSELHLDYITPGLAPIDIRYERDSDIGDAGPWAFANDVVASSYDWPSGGTDLDNNFADDDSWAAEALADRIYLYDPDVATPMMEGISFAGIDRVGMKLFNAEVLVDLHTEDKLPSWYSDDGFEGEAFAIPEDLTAMDRALRTIVVAKAARDRIAVSFETTQPLVMRDLETTDETTTLGEQRRALL